MTWALGERRWQLGRNWPLEFEDSGERETEAVTLKNKRRAGLGEAHSRGLPLPREQRSGEQLGVKHDLKEREMTKRGVYLYVEEMNQQRGRKWIKHRISRREVTSKG